MLKKFNRVGAYLGLAGLGMALAASAASAQTYNGNTVYKTIRPDGSPQIIIANRTAGERLSVTFPGAESTYNVTANGCGLIVLRDSTTRQLADLVSVDGAAIDQASLPTQLLPRCVNGTLEEARSANFKTGAGEVVIVKSPNTVYKAVYAGGRDRSVTANACGFATIRSTSTLDITAFPNFTIGSTSYNLTTLADAGVEPLCRSGALYIPSAWP